jgi:autotransporter passenger strand-loop-strand repeat protein
VSAGGIASFTTVSSGTEWVSSGGTAKTTTVDGGTQDVMSSGSAQFTIVDSGIQNVFAGGSAISTTVGALGVQPRLRRHVDQYHVEQRRFRAGVQRNGHRHRRE